MTSRNNPWGSKTYAELITEAIISTPLRRLSLAQIYDHLLSILPYPNHRIDNTSYAGWKNSIRHNLSLHERFVKIPNERPGKPCWWTVNTDKPLGKKQRKTRTETELIVPESPHCEECQHQVSPHHQRVSQPAQFLAEREDWSGPSQQSDQYGQHEEELIKAWDGVLEGQRVYQDYCMEYKEDLFYDGDHGDIINDIERIQQALLGLSSIDTEAEFRQLFDEL